MNNQINPFELEENSIDFKAYIFKILKYWWLFALTVILALFITRYFNKRKERLYQIKTTINIQEEQSPLFSANTNIMFSWGETSDKVENIKSILISRTHNEKVLNKLKSYTNYYQKGEYRLNDIYTDAPFEINIDKSYPQVINLPLELDFNESNVTIKFNTNDSNQFILYNYTSNSANLLSDSFKFSKTYNLKEDIVSKFFNFKITQRNQLNSASGKYYIKFRDFNSLVTEHQKINIKSPIKGASILSLNFKGPNKNKIADFLNTSIQVLEEDQKNAKIQYAVNTKKYIDQLLTNVGDSLKKIEVNLGKFKQQNRIYDLTAEGSSFFGNLSELDRKKQQLKGRIEYYDNLKTYLDTHNNIDGNIPVPAIVEIEDQTIGTSVKELIGLYRVKETLEQKVTSEFPQLKQTIRQINSTRNVLIENIRTLKATMNVNLNNINSQITRFNSKLSSLPKKEQGLIKYQRSYNLTEANYNYLLQKRYEAGTIIAANVSDIKVIDKAKDIGQYPIYPKPLINYLIGLIIGLLLPLLFVIIKELLNNKITTVEDLENKYKIPVLGVIGKNTANDNLIVYRKPKSTTSEGFRALRSNLQFLFKNNNHKTKTILVTSTVSGEGKTFISMNMATVFANTEKKTILLGFDLRKPRIFDDFELKNNIGLTNYLVGDASLEAVTHQTRIPNLDLILSGPIPPNPSELIISNKANELIDILKDKYDYIVIDTPPIGLVADSIELFKHVDAALYVVRQGETHKNMPKMINDKYKNGEVSNISFVLNDFSEKKAGYGYGGYGYGYGGYGGYGKSYGQGYHDNEEEVSWFKRIFKKK